MKTLQSENRSDCPFLSFKHGLPGMELVGDVSLRHAAVAAGLDFRPS